MASLNKHGFAKFTLISLLFALLFLFLVFFLPVFAEGLATIWTTDADANLKIDFEPQEMVYIRGENFRENKKVDVSVTRPDAVTDSGFTFSDSIGSFVYEYPLTLGIEGIYTVVATDKVNIAETVFTDATINFTQCKNDTDNDNTLDDCDWTTGSLNQNNSIYAEGNVVPHRLFHKIADAGTHTIRFSYQFSKGDVYAYDFLSTPDLTQSGANFNPCGQLPGFVSASECSTLFSSALSPSVPSDSFDAVSTRENPAVRSVYIGGVSSPSVTIVGHDPSTSCFQNCGDSDVLVDVTFTTSAPNTIVALWFGGNLAMAGDPDGAGPLDGWGEGYGASSISGAPFHVSYVSLNGGAVGKRDNQIQPGAVVPVLECIVDADCADTGNECTENLCIENSCVETPKEISTSCEADSDLCTIDHCDGNGTCTLLEDVFVPEPEQCNSFYCDSADGQVKEDYSGFPLSTSCEADSDLCTIDHCDGVGGCVTYDNVSVPEPEQCTSYFCNPGTGEIEPIFESYSTPCEADSDLCTIDHCDGAGTCTLLDNVYVPPAEQCNSFYCDPTDGQIKEDYTDFPLSTSCEADDSLCTIDHCDGIGACITYDEVDVPADEQCNSFYCDPADGQVKEDYTGFPLSTSCEADDSLCTIDHCDGGGSCVNYDDVPVPDPEQCNSFYCDPSDGQVKDDYSNYPLSTPCEADSDLCTIDHCDGAGTCTWLEDTPVPGPEQCNSYFCDPNDGQIKEDYTDFPLSTPCEADSDLCSIDHCDGGGECVWMEDTPVPGPEQCNSFYCDPNDGQIKEDYTDFPLSTPCEADDDICTDDHCDGTGECVFQKSAVNEISTIKTVGVPKVICDYFGEGQEASECWHIISSTPISLEAIYDGPYNAYTVYRTRWKEDFGDLWGAWGSLNIYEGPFSLAEDSIHELEYYSVDSVCDVNEPANYEIDIVDNQAPEPNKIVGEPKIVWDGLDSIFYDLEEFCQEPENCWRVTLFTPISLECSDPGPHPVDSESVCFFLELDGDNATEAYCEEYGGTINEGDGYCCVGQTIEGFYFLEESEHNLKYYCVDALGNKGSVDDEKFKVEGDKFRIVLNKKWNLISVPFRLIDSNIAVVFGDVLDSIESVWTYDATIDQWFIYRPSNQAISNLADLHPGWGYWVASLDNNVVVIVGGSLFNTGPITPPSKDLADGWNLIGYYGVDWQENKPYPYCEEGDELLGTSIYCGLGSLVDTQEGYPRWSSLMGYVNCGNDDTQWLWQSICGENSNIHAGKGYWIEIDQEEGYAPATTCIGQGACI